MPPRIQQLLDAEAATVKQQLEQLSPKELLAPAAIVSRDDAMLVKAAVYLRHGFLDECHKIAQRVETPNGSYWHAIMHRKEGDFSNSKYWYRRVGAHPVFAALGRDWDAARFVDQCAKGNSDPVTEKKEFDALLDHTVRCATGAAS